MNMTPAEYKAHCAMDTLRIGQVVTSMDNIDFLTIVYEDYCTKHSLPYVSADEQDLNEMDEKHVNWLYNFNQMWDLAINN